MERSSTGADWLIISKVYGAGNSTTLKTYQTEDKEPGNSINYYRLTQTDFDGQEKKFSIVSIDNSSYNSITILKTVDFLGREVSNDYEGLRLVFYSDGTVVKRTGK